MLLVAPQTSMACCNPCLIRGVSGSGDLSVSCSDGAPELTTHSASINLHASMRIAHRYNEIPEIRSRYISIILA